MAATIGFGDLQNQGQQDPNQQQGQNQGQQQSSAPSQTPGAGQQGNVVGSQATNAGGTGGGGGNAGSQYKPQAYSQQTQGTGFVNLQQYLNANNPTQLQNAVVSNLGSQNQAALGGLQASQQQFQQGLQSNQANTMANQRLVQNVLNNPTAYSAATGANVPGVGTPGGIVNPSPRITQPNLTAGSQFSQLIGGQYAGPTGLSNAQQLAGQGTSAAQQAANLQSPGGRTSILQGMMANPNYTQGQAALDTALLGQGDQTALNQVANQSRQLQNVINQATTGATAQGQEAASNAQQFGQQVQGQLTQNVQGQLANLQNQAAVAQQQQNAAYQQMQQDIQSGNVTPQEAQLLGLTQGENLYGLNLSNYLTQNPLQATASNIATPQQYAQMQALQQLAGSAAPTAATSIFQQFANPSQAGTFSNAPIANANIQAAQAAVQGQQQNFQQQLQALTSSLAPGLNIGAIGQGNNSILGSTAAGAAAGAGAGAAIGSPGGVMGTGLGSMIGGLVGGVGGLVNSGQQTAAESQARESAKQSESANLQTYYNNLKNLAGQFGMNLGQYQNMSPAQLATLFDPNNVGAGTNYQNIINSLQNSLQANNLVNVAPAQQSSAIGPQMSNLMNPPNLESGNVFNVS